MAEAGAKVVVADKDQELAEKTVEMINDRKGFGKSIGADLTNPSDCKHVVDFAMSQFGRLDILDNNVGIASSLSVVEETEEYWDRVMENI